MNILDKIDLPTVLILYLSKQFLKRFGLILIGLSAILLVFDVLANADDVLEFQQGSITAPLISYALLRIPEILILSLPFAVLLSMMTILAKLVANQEIIALRSVGISSYHLVGYFSAGLLLIMVAHFLFANLLLSYTSPILRSWSEQDYKGAAGEEMTKEVPGWFALDGNIINIGRASDAGDVLYDVDFIKRDDIGLVDNVTTIAVLRYRDGMWTSPDNAMRLALPFEPIAFSSQTQFEREMSYGALLKALRRDQYLSEGQKTIHHVWLQRKFAGPLGTLIMVLVAMPIALQISRRGNIMTTATACLLAGFSYFILERLFLTLGETAYLPPMIAVWTPAMLFIILGAWILLLLEG